VARYDKNMDASAARPLSVGQLHELLDQSAAGSAERTDAVACFVAGAEGWRQAAEQLGGAFAECEAMTNRRGPIDDRSR
jgi:hypothetical protein